MLRNSSYPSRVHLRLMLVRYTVYRNGSFMGPSNYMLSTRRPASHQVMPRSGHGNVAGAVCTALQAMPNL